MEEVICPHCGGFIEILQLNCGIFRHGIFKANGQQIPPHAPKEAIEAWLAAGALRGCGQPFRVVHGKAILCDYC